MTSSIPSLRRLPPELILEIADYLPLDGRLALSYTHSQFEKTLFIPRESKKRKIKNSNCARLAIRTYQSPPNASYSHTRCIRCKQSYPTSMFFSGGSPSCITPPSSQDQEVIPLPERFCCWCVGSFVRHVRTEVGGKNEWVAENNTMCMHCGAVKEWKQCKCNCDTCWNKPVITYTRYLNNDEEYKTARIGKKACCESSTGFRLFVREDCFKPSKLRDVGEILLGQHLHTNADR